MTVLLLHLLIILFGFIQFETAVKSHACDAGKKGDFTLYLIRKIYHVRHMFHEGLVMKIFSTAILHPILVNLKELLTINGEIIYTKYW